jgi:L-alanine-DL-glutamate epimerase-like enolase superfamily enzyme
MPEELTEKAAELRGFPLIKVKSDDRAELEPIQLVQQESGAKIAVDANCSWENVEISEISRNLAKMGVIFLEQPFHPEHDVRMAEESIASELPIFADESCVVLEDIERLTGRFAGFNMKLSKCGGLTPGLAMLRRGRELGLRSMVGCMLESSLGIAAGAVVAQQTEFADLDGAWLLRDDVFTGLPLERGLLVPSGPGFGVTPVFGLFPE